jgi:hypothetical protein
MAQAPKPTGTGGPDVTVTASDPLYITDGNRNFGRVTIEPGGQVWVQTQADITMDVLERKQ